jgi:hypothetical protein
MEDQMDAGQISCDRSYCILKKEIDSVSGKTILLKQLLAAVEVLNLDMPAWLQSPEGWTVFTGAVRQLVAEGLLVPMGKATRQDLYGKYRIIRPVTVREKQITTQIIKSIAPPASLDYYLKNPQDFLTDREIIETMIAFLKQPSPEWLTTNERAYQLFGDEKFLKGDPKDRSRGAVVLKRLGLDYASLGCEETWEPFFSFCQKDCFAHKARRIYIIENKDTFWSFKAKLMDTPSRLKSDMLIYGEGRKIVSSFQFVAEYDLNGQDDCFFYFGDLDAEGLNIYCELTKRYPQYRIFPFAEGYQALLEIGSRRGMRKTPQAQKMKPDNVASFLQEFPPSWAIKIRRLLEDGQYIPQEALSASQMRERFGKV